MEIADLYLLIDKILDDAKKEHSRALQQDDDFERIRLFGISTGITIAVAQIMTAIKEGAEK